MCSKRRHRQSSQVQHLSPIVIITVTALSLAFGCSTDLSQSTHGTDDGSFHPTEFPPQTDGQDGGEGREELDSGPGPRPEQVFIPAPATLHRLSTSERRASVKTVFGFVPITTFEQETSLHGSARVANAELTISPQLTEQIETFAWAVAESFQDAPEQLLRYFPCPFVQGAVSRSCIGAGVLELGRALWRRPLDEHEMERLITLYEALRGRSLTERSHHKAAAGIVAALIQSPDFAFRVEVGEPDPDHPADQPPIIWRYTSDEMASRLSYFIWGTSPDPELQRAADDGSLLTDQGVRTQTTRLLNDPRAVPHFMSYFDELIGLEFLETVSKNAELFPAFSRSLRASMRAEINALFSAVAFERDADFRELLTSDRSSVDNELAALYGVSLEAPLPPGERVTITLPPDQDRGGILGRAAPLALFSHATVNSPTFRGRFVRSGLLCQDVPPPPEGAVAELEEAPVDEVQTLRERLEQHATDPQCAGCHQLMDPLGYPLERFDPIGQWRDLDNGLPIDSTGDLDGVAVDGARELGRAVADSPSFSNCMTRRLYRYAVSHLESHRELTLIGEIDDRFKADHSYRFKALVLEIVMSDAFRRLSPQESTVDETGQEVAIEGCGGVERCNGADNDCDGKIDESVVQVCENGCGWRGVQVCNQGQWSSCELGELPPETCDGQDNDCDGEIDEDVESASEICDGQDNDCDGAIDENVGSSVHEVPFGVLTRFHDGCRIDQRDMRHCNAAINRFCQSLSCGGTGFGPIESGWQSVSVICLPDNLAQRRQVTYQELAGRHHVCDGQREGIGPNCNAAIHRHCSQIGQVTGFGPLERGPDDVEIACVPSATIVNTTYTDLSSHHGDCHQNGERIGPNCNAAINRLCSSRGFRSGWGPVENFGDQAVIVCVD